MDLIDVGEEIKSQILRGDKLLMMCHKMKCELDGLNRPEPLKFHIGLNYDQFAEDIEQALLNHLSLLKMSSLEKGLLKLGSVMRDAKIIEVSSEDDLASAALEHVMSLYGLTVGDVSEKIKDQVRKGVELFLLCKQLGKNKNLDKKDKGFCGDIDMSIKLHQGLLKKFQLMTGLSDLGRKLSREKIIMVDFGEELSVATIRYLLDKHGVK